MKERKRERMKEKRKIYVALTILKLLDEHLSTRAFFHVHCWQSQIFVGPLDHQFTFQRVLDLFVDLLLKLFEV